MRYTPAQIIGKKISKLRMEGYSEESKCIQTLRAELREITDLYLNSPKIRLEYPIHLFAGRKISNSQTDLNNVFDLIKSPNDRLISNKYEYFLKNAPEYLDQYTKVLKRYTPCGLFYTSTERIDIQKLNGILMLKTNEGKLSEKDKKRISSSKHTFAFYRQLLKDHYIILVKCKGITHKNYVDFQRIAEEYYQSLIGETKLYAPIINEQVFLSNDTTLFHNPDAIPLNKI